MLQNNIPHQMVQSPARLGLPAPNSPSVQNTNPPKFTAQSQQPQQTSSNQLATNRSVSATLLPLLPPLPRAQALLLQMASLASKLFEVSPNRAHWISSFRGSLPTFLSSQTQSLTPAAPTTDSAQSSAKEILAQFTAIQGQLVDAVAQLQEILDLQDAKQKTAREIRSNDSALLTFANKVKEAENVLDNLVDDYSDYHRLKRSKTLKTVEGADDDSTTTVATHFKLSDILSYAHRISYTTFAPPEFGAGQAPLRGALPPAPQEEQMRASELYNFANLDIGLPKTDEDKDTIFEPLIEPESNLPANQGLLPPNIVVPSGWKPGMPVELPLDIPMQPPAGWKPGDPITLPPMDSLQTPARVEEQPRPLPPGLPKALEPIQVRHVQLDIEDDSSDYSSDVGSSDSED